MAGSWYFAGDFIKVETVTHVVVCADCLRVVVHHDGLVAQLVWCGGGFMVKICDGYFV